MNIGSVTELANLPEMEWDASKADDCGEIHDVAIVDLFPDQLDYSHTREGRWDLCRYDMGDAEVQRLKVGMNELRRELGLRPKDCAASLILYRTVDEEGEWGSGPFLRVYLRADHPAVKDMAPKVDAVLSACDLEPDCMAAFEF